MKFALFDRKFQIQSSLALMAAFLVSGCGGADKKPPLDYVPHMSDSFAVKAQHLDPFGKSMRVPPAGTISQEMESPYPYIGNPDAAGRELKNPLPRKKEVLLKGQKVFNTYCIVCHGSKGEGDGSVVPKFPRPPSLHSDKVRNWSDGSIYHVITAGQNLMPSYATQITPQERWAVVHYVRVLQRALNPTDADIREMNAAKAAMEK